jgi:hypothetical protein
MFALDLFNTDHERRIAEGAVDQLEQRRIDDLAMKMDELVARAKEPAYKKNPAALAGLMKEFQKCKAERDSYYNVRNETMGYGGLGETGLPDVADKAAKMARLNQPGKVGTDAVSPQQRVNPNPDKGIVGHAVDWLRGKGGPGKEGPTYESKVDEGFGPVGSKALMNGNLATFMKARQTRTPVTLEIGGEEFRLTPAIMDAMAKKYNDDKAAADSDPSNKDVKLIAINNYRSFGYPDMMRKFIDAVATPEATPPAGEPGEQLPMFEKSQQLQKKKSNNDSELNSSSVRDTKLSRELTKARGAYPTASSDIEALVRQELDTGERIKQDVGSIQTTNTAQDQTLSQLEKVNQQQTAQIAGLEKQLSTVAQQAQQPARVAPAPQATPTAQTPATAKSADIPIATDIPEPTTPRDQEIYNKVQSLEKELKDKIDAMASWNAITQKDTQSNNELVALRKEVDRTRKELQTQINKLTKANKEPGMARQAPQTTALPDPNVVDVDAWEIPDMETAQELQPIAARENTEKPTAIGQMAKNVGQGQELQQDPAYRSQVRRTQQQAAQRQQNIAQQKAGYDNDPDEFEDIPDINEGAMKEIDIMRQDLERMNDRQFYTAYGISKAAFQQKYRTLLKPALDEGQGLHQGDPIVVTGSNEFEGKTGEIHELSPSRKFVIVNLYNHGKHSMHLSDVEYNQYADKQDEDDWYDEGLAESDVNPQFINSQVTKLLARATQIGNFDPLSQLLTPLMKQYGLTLQQIDTMVPGGLKKAAGEYGVAMKEGWSDAFVSQRTGQPRTPYSVYIKGKKWKDFENDDHARAVMDKLKAKFKADGRDPETITIAPADIPEDAATPPPEAPRPAIIAPAPAAKYMVKKPQAPTAKTDVAPSYPKVSPYSDDESTLKIYKPEQYRDVSENGNRVDPILIKALNRMPDGLATHGEVLNAAYDAYAMELGRMEMKSNYGVTNAYIPQLMDLYKDKYGLDIKETVLNPKDPKSDYAAKRKALQDLGMNKAVDQAAVLRRRLDLDREAKAKGVAEGEVYDLEKEYGYKKPMSQLRRSAPNDYPFSQEEDEDYFREIFRKKREVAAKAKAQGGSLNELSTEKLAQYKKSAGTDASAADKAGNFERGNKRFKGIVRATIKQGNNDAKKHPGIAESAMSNLHADLADVYNRMAPGIERNRDSFKAGQLYDALEAVAEQHGAETEFKRMMNGARNRAHMDYDTNPGGFHNWFWYLPFAEEDVEEGLMKEPTNRKEYLDQRDKLFRMMAVDSNPANKQIIKQALQDLEARYGNLKKAVKEEFNTGSEAVERAILNRIMVAHTDLLMKFGPDKVMQAAEEVAYNVGDVDEIGTSDVSAYVHQVKQILGVPEEVNEKWSQKYKSSINCANPKGFSQKAHCASKKK